MMRSRILMDGADDGLIGNLRKELKKWRSLNWHLDIEIASKALEI